MFSNTDEIINLRKIEDTNIEEKKMETENQTEKNSVVESKSNAGRYHSQNGKIY